MPRHSRRGAPRSKLDHVTSGKEPKPVVTNRVPPPPPKGPYHPENAKILGQRMTEDSKKLRKLLAADDPDSLRHLHAVMTRHLSEAEEAHRTLSHRLLVAYLQHCQQVCSRIAHHLAKLSSSPDKPEEPLSERELYVRWWHVAAEECERRHRYVQWWRRKFRQFGYPRRTPLLTKGQVAFRKVQMLVEAAPATSIYFELTRSRPSAEVIPFPDGATKTPKRRKRSRVVRHIGDEPLFYAGDPEALRPSSGEVISASALAMRRRARHTKKKKPAFIEPDPQRGGERRQRRRAANQSLSDLTSTQLNDLRLRMLTDIPPRTERCSSEEYKAVKQNTEHAVTTPLREQAARVALN